MSESGAPRRRIGRSILALAAGFVVAVVLSLGTDFGLHAVGLYPVIGGPMSENLLVAATIYRTIYSVASSYVTALLAPYKPMGHALVGGAIGLALSTLGAVTTWNKGMGPHWYPLALVVLALPSAWLGGRLRVMQNGGSHAEEL